MKSVKVLTRIFDRIKSLVAFGWLPSPDPASLQVTFQVPYDKLSESAQQALYDHIQLLQYIGCQVIVAPLTEQIPDGYIGLVTYLCGEKSEYRKYLQLQVKYVEKTELVYRWPDELNPVIV